MKLELKHLSPYLPYKLNCLCGKKIEVIQGLRNETYFIDKGSNYSYGYIEDCKPILRPLSDLTKEINLKGKEFMPLKQLFIEIIENSLDYEEIKIYTQLEDINDGITRYCHANAMDIFFNIYVINNKIHRILSGAQYGGGSSYLNYQQIICVNNFLVEWHFDVFGLIEKGLAIDINTLKL